MFNNSFHTLDLNSSKSPGEASSTAQRRERAFYININFSKFSDCDSVVSALNMNYKVASNWRNNIFLVENFILYILFFISNYPKNLSNQYMSIGFTILVLIDFMTKLGPILLQKLHLEESTLEKHLIKFFHWDKPTFHSK